MKKEHACPIVISDETLRKDETSMLFNGYDILISFSMQQFQCNYLDFSLKNDEETSMTFLFNSTMDTNNVVCPYCSGRVNIYDYETTRLKDIPIWINIPLDHKIKYHRYQCLQCNKTFAEDICFKYPGTRITRRAANYIETLLRNGVTVLGVQRITGIHWDTIKKVHAEMMNADLEERKNHLRKSGYKPKYLAVDEFAIHRGHTYATCVMDLVEGDIIWVGKGRSMKDFIHFFQETDMDYLSDVKAVAMDMNTSYNRLVELYLPNAAIVYDRYHMQAQFGKDVIGAVRLEEAKEHHINAKELLKEAVEETDYSVRRELKKQAKNEMHNYTTLKGARWSLLTKQDNLTDPSRESLQSILSSHERLAICYAMKEEMTELFELKDPEIARERWLKWFDAAKSSNIPQLEKFALLKEKRIDGLVAHSIHPISTGRLEGLNNKIKVAKRIGYGYRDDDYFFTLIQHASIPLKT